MQLVYVDVHILRLWGRFLDHQLHVQYDARIRRGLRDGVLPILLVGLQFLLVEHKLRLFEPFELFELSVDI
jgi:hypothetical protein